MLEPRLGSLLVLGRHPIGVVGGGDVLVGSLHVVPGGLPGEPEELVARAELLRCAAQAASLALTQACPPFEALQQDAAGPEKAYANYLLGRPLAADELALLPPAQRPVATALAQSSAANAAALLKGVEDPLSRLVAAGTLFRAGQAGREVVALAVDAASAQGWRRPLMAWLTVQAV